MAEESTTPDLVELVDRGREGMARALRQWMEPLEEGARVEPERIVGSDDPLVTGLRFHGKARYAGIESDMTYSCLYGFRDGKTIYMKTFLDAQEALDAAGPAE
jgi:ketosteroid isomerase-like protein